MMLSEDYKNTHLSKPSYIQVSADVVILQEMWCELQYIWFYKQIFNVIL